MVRVPLLPLRERKLLQINVYSVVYLIPFFWFLPDARTSFRLTLVFFLLVSPFGHRLETLVIIPPLHIIFLPIVVSKIVQVSFHLLTATDHAVMALASLGLIVVLHG